MLQNKSLFTLAMLFGLAAAGAGIAIASGAVSAGAAVSVTANAPVISSAITNEYQETPPIKNATFQNPLGEGFVSLSLLAGSPHVATADRIVQLQILNYYPDGKAGLVSASRFATILGSEPIAAGDECGRVTVSLKAGKSWLSATLPDDVEVCGSSKK